jgi:hypothetical protein
MAEPKLRYVRYLTDGPAALADNVLSYPGAQGSRDFYNPT